MEVQRMDGPGAPDFWVVVKALMAAAAGRALLILNATRQETPSVQKLIGVALYEIPVTCAFALLGWNVAPLLGAHADEWRVTLTVILAWTGQRGLDTVLQRVLPSQPGEQRKPTDGD